MRRFLVVWALALGAGALPGGLPPRPVIGLIPSASEATTEALTDGIRLALEEAAAESGLRIDLVVGPEATHWSTAAPPAVELAFVPGLVGLITPPERAIAHLVAQIGSRAHVPVLTTARASSIGATGSYWVVPLRDLSDTPDTANPPPPVVDRSYPGFEAFRDSFRDRFGHDPDGWAQLGYRAALALHDALRSEGPDRYRIARALNAAAVARPPS